MPLLTPQQDAKLVEWILDNRPYKVAGWIDGPVFRVPVAGGRDRYLEITSHGCTRKVGQRERAAMNADAWTRWVLAIKAVQAVAA